MVKIEAFGIHHFVQQTDRVCHTDYCFPLSPSPCVQGQTVNVWACEHKEEAPLLGAQLVYTGWLEHRPLVNFHMQ